MLELLMRGVSTRAYGEAIGEMAETVGVSRSSVSPRAAEAARARLVALGVDTEGSKRILGIREGASENAAVALALLEELVERSLDPARAKLFVINGPKALRKAVS